MTTLQPFGDRVLILPIEEPTKVGSIHIPETAKERPTRGMIVEVGEDVDKLSKGTVVVYPKYSGSAYTHEDKEYVIMKEEDILAWFQDS